MVENDLDFGILSVKQKVVSGCEGNGNQAKNSDVLDKPRAINSQAHRNFVDYMFSIVESCDSYRKEH